MKLAVAVLLASGVASADTLRGTVVDKTTHEPVAGAIVTVADQLLATDDAGTFIAELPAGRYTVDITAEWLEPVKQPVTLRGELTLTIEVEAAANLGGETIEVVDIAPTQIGETRIDAKLARAVPGGGDAAKVVQALPAVARPPAGSAEIVVWGAAPRDTRVFVDGVPVPSLYHLGGYRAAVGNDLVGDIRLTPAAFGPDRGRAIGGVIDIGLTDDLPAWRAQADVLDISAAAHQTLGRVSIAGAIRKSWLDRAIDLVADPQELAPNAPLPKWTDGQLALKAKLDHMTLGGFVLGSIDELDRTLSSDDPATRVEQQIDQRWLRAQVGLRTDTASASLWVGRDHSTDDLRVGLIPADQHTAQWVGGARAQQQSRLSDAFTLTLGLDVDGERAHLTKTGSLTIPAREGDLHIFGQPPGDDTNADTWNATTIDAAGYSTLDIRDGRITATAGARADTWLLDASRLTPRIGQTPGIGTQDIEITVDPRASVQLRISDELGVRADAGRYHQARAASDTSAVFGTPNLGLEQAWHATVGGQWRRSPFALEVAGYARWLDDLVSRDLAVTPLLAQTLTQDGTGEVLGIQLTARAVGWRGLSGWLSYGLSKSTRRDAANGAERYFDRDQTHGLIAVGGWQHAQWNVGARVRIATGEPRTDVIGAFFDSHSGRFQPIVGEHNGVRLPMFFAADLRGERKFAHGAVYVEVQNLTGRANAEEIIYSADYATRGYLTGLPLLAIAGVRVEQ
jgi:hypothetical protein